MDEFIYAVGKHLDRAYNARTKNFTASFIAVSRYDELVG
jgi:hypothetical protein